MSHIAVKRALISVSDKLGLAAFARGLAAAGVQLYSTGGTRRHLQEAGLTVEEVSAYTGSPEMMEGRVKTLHPKIHGGILFRRDNPEDVRQAAEQGIVGFDLVVVNLYPFEATVARPNVTDAEAIEQIDIGGPSLIRAAAKNHRFVAVATSPEQYAEILEQITANGGTSLDLRRRLAGEAFARSAQYDQTIAQYFAMTGVKAESEFPLVIPLVLRRKMSLRYGENPHQRGALYAGSGAGAANLVSAHQLHGKELSYNNLLDLDCALAIARQFDEPTAIVIKHNNPCGAATDSVLAIAMRRGLDGDSLSAFGSVIGLNRTVDAATAEVLTEPERFVEAIVAPDFDPAAFEILTTRPKWKASVRLLEVGPISAVPPTWEYRQIAGGFLVQDGDTAADTESEWKVVTEAKPSDEQFAELRFAWKISRHVKSNAIVLAHGRTLVGVGAGQMSRVDSVEIAVRKAGARAVGAVLASDAFFPFADSIPVAATAGVTAVIQPGGSRRDDEVIAACNRFGLPMIFTGRRHFKH
ncbi:MAG TPA: bifunctional phosphoribosylaminoimidazolecarboxamide formyltransferase/IMP cyclohydrolase [Pirellulales bacterium]|jgi:phosphoribosylaminoimidazolecarboxamide formyltransferase/IMP cyclohydrolase|nr:bifunctional phosphoribosylaminoimidazolecarboxamide formyltransferase/IMP cyclohydrolase [Pirellulales bacterium]